MAATLLSRGVWLLAFSLPVVGTAAERTPRDWPSWRGPNRDAVSQETGLLKSWPASGPPLAWRVDGLGKGYSSVAIADGRIFTMGERQRRARLIALDLRDGSAPA